MVDAIGIVMLELERYYSKIMKSGPGVGTGIILSSGNTQPQLVKASTAFYPPLLLVQEMQEPFRVQLSLIHNCILYQNLSFYDGTSWQSELPGMTLGLTVALDG